MENFKLDIWRKVQVSTRTSQTPKTESLGTSGTFKILLLLLLLLYNIR